MNGLERPRSSSQMASNLMWQRLVQNIMNIQRPLPTVERSSIKQDLSRRDFTINALAIALNAGRFGELLDFYGGQRDIKEKKIRVLHSLSMIEDPTRTFRAVRFAERFGFALSTETVRLIKGAVSMGLFQRLSKSRLTEEFISLLSEEEPVGGMTRLAQLNVLHVIHSDLWRIPAFETVFHSIKAALDWYKLSYFNRHMRSWIVYCMGLLDSLSHKAGEEMLQSLAFPVKDRRLVKEGHAALPVLRRLNHPSLQPSEIYHLLEGYADETLVFLMAKSSEEQARRRISAYMITDRHVTPILTGDDLKAMGLFPGPMFKTLLTAVLDARLNGEAHTEADERHVIEQLRSEYSE